MMAVIVMVVIMLLSQRHAVDLVACLVEEANRDSGGVFRKQGKVGSF